MENQVYLWNKPSKPIPEYLWCPKNECNSINYESVMLDFLCKKKNSLICLGTRKAWMPAPYVCKRIRANDREYSLDFLCHFHI